MGAHNGKMESSMRTTTIHVAIAAAIATVATFCAMAAETGNGLGQKTGEPQSGLRHLKVCRAHGGGQPVVDAAPPATNGAFRIMSYNVRFGKGMDGVIDYIAIDKTHAKDFSVLRSYEVPDRKTSDHSPIVVELKPAERERVAPL